MDNKKYVVYKHIFPNKKSYIGITSKKPKNRWQNGNGYSKEKQNVMYNAIQKYGWENVKHIILYKNLSFEEASQKEKELISKFHTYIKDPLCNGYNMTIGGEGSFGHNMSEEGREKQRKRLLGKVGYECCNSIQVICDGVEYESITKFAEINNLKRHNVECWLNGKHNMPKIWLDKGLRYKDKIIEYKVQEKPHKNVFIYNNIIFDSQKELSNYLNINTATLSNWINKKASVPREVYDNGIYREDGSKIELVLNIKENKKIFYDNKIYNSQRELAKELNINFATLNSYLTGKNKIPKELKEKGLSYYI